MKYINTVVQLELTLDEVEALKQIISFIHNLDPQCLRSDGDSAQFYEVLPLADLPDLNLINLGAQNEKL